MAWFREGIRAMPSFRASELLPTGFCAVGVLSGGDSAVVTIRAMSANSSRPSCGAVSNRVHSQYPRRLADLPIAGRRAVLVLQARRFRCEEVLCERRIFTERFDDNILKPWARRTARLDHIVHCLAIALGGRPAASFARRLSIPVSNDTLLRAVRRRGSPSFPPPAIIGIDDWAWRRNHRYGTLICDLERRKIIALLPDREPATAAAWLSGQPQIAVVARDRGGGYALAAQKALPNAVQVADRWHLMENASHAFLDAVRKSMRQIRSAIGAATINPDLLTAAEKLQYEGYVRREETNAAILAMAKERAMRRDDQGDRAKRRLHPRPRAKGASRSEVGRLPRPQQFARSLSSLARRTMGGGTAQWLRAMALPEAAWVSKSESKSDTRPRNARVSSPRS